MDNEALAQLVNRSVGSGGRSVGSAGPGAAVGIYRGGALVAHAAAGLACVEFAAPIDEHTRFDIASMSKQFTATAILLLARDGLLRLDDDIRSHLPELHLNAPVTIAQCLHHTGGLAEWLQLAAIAGRPLTRITQDQTLAFVSGLETPDFTPGSAFRYSNTGYVLATSLVHRLTGHTLGEFAQERIFTPLGMERTFFREDSRVVAPQFAYGYDTTGDALRRADTEESAVGDGGLVTSLSELAPWFRFLRDGEVLGADIRDALVDDRPTFPDGTVGPYAFGLFHADLGDQHVIGHAGAAEGYRSQLHYLPALDLGVVVLANDSAVRAGPLATLVARSAAGIIDAPPEPRVDAASAAGPAEGWWIMRDGDEQVRTVADDDGTVVLSGLQSGRFALTADGSWRGMDDQDDLRLHLTTDRMRISADMRPGRDHVYERCQAPDPALPHPVGSFLDSEIGILLVIRQDGTFRLGLENVGRIEPGADGTFRAGPAVLRRDGDDLRLSAYGVSALTFARQPDGTALVGVPRGL